MQPFRRLLFSIPKEMTWENGKVWTLEDSPEAHSYAKQNSESDSL